MIVIPKKGRNRNLKIEKRKKTAYPRVLLFQMNLGNMKLKFTKRKLMKKRLKKDKRKKDKLINKKID